jgi:hypothetical protein
LVQDGDRWWASIPGSYATNEADRDSVLGFGPELSLINTAPFVGEAVLELLGEDRLAGRAVALLRARPRGRVEGSELFDGSGTPFDIAIDIETGVLLRERSFEVTRVGFDGDLPEDLFSAPSRPSDPHEVMPSAIPRWIMPEDRSAVGFSIHQPKLLPEGARPVPGMVSGDDSPRWIDLRWAVDPGFRYQLHVRQGPGLLEEASREEWPSAPDGEPRVFEHAGGPMLRHSTVVVRRAGHWFEVTSDLPLELVLGIAASIGADP